MNCSYNKMVDCESRKRCLMCGWNPRVSSERVSKLQAKLASEPPVEQISIIPAREEVWTYRV